jgi:uncharacterized protein (TIGR03435 family)
MLLHNQHRAALHPGLLAMLALHTASAQTGIPERLTFEVASVKPATSTGGRFTMSGGPATGDPGRIIYTNIMLRRVLLNAYDLRSYQILGPDWLDTLRFDITANVPEGTTKEQFQAMLRNLLATRFQMRSHRESRELPIYAMVAAKSGPKLKPAGLAAAQAEDQLAVIRPTDGKDGFPALSLPAGGLVLETRNGRARVTGKESALSKLADLLSGQLGRPVIDMTGLAGNYSFVVYFAPEGINPDAASDPGLFAALQQQLGLRLEARTGPVELLMIDYAEKVPAEN